MLKNAISSDCANMSAYQRFIIDCRNKIYDPSFVLHVHHIIPKSLWLEEFGDVNAPDNLVLLSVEDHAKAHYLHGISYPSDTLEHVNNMRSSRFLKAKSIRDKDAMKIISESYCGEGNPFYGKTHSSETKSIISAKIKDLLTGTAYSERYGESRQIKEKEKRSVGVKNSWGRMSEEERKIRSSNIAKSLKGLNRGGDNGFAIPITVDGTYYGSIADAVRILNISHYLLFKKHTVIKLNESN